MTPLAEATPRHAPVQAEPVARPVHAAAAASLDEARRRLKIRLLRDLVANGLYRVRVDELAERLLPVVRAR